MSAGNQQGSPLSRSAGYDPSETTRRAPLKAYLLGALHDGTYNRFHKTFRISQKGSGWLERLKLIFQSLNYKAWIYKEGKNRDVYVLETTAHFLDIKFDPSTLKSKNEQIAYVRGYFDSEGGIPHSLNACFYIQLCQKDKEELRKVKQILNRSGIECGKIHNPSKKVDPNYWRLYILAKSHKDFIRKISSWHPKKSMILSQRMMI